MESQFKRLEYLVGEFTRLGIGSDTKKIMPALRVGNQFLHMEEAYSKVAGRKIQFISYYLTSKGVRVKRSNSSESIYFYINNQSFRVSDHKSNRPDIQHQFVVRYDSCVVQVLHEIRMAHFKPDQYFG
jgi:hypothetical protein